ncbi:tRNA pseudouridine(55) synthase TruB [Thiohalophilus sp.]|uniref:tRNA pseudouridine(55) synthase TruB n=1 Tax=Thiohalophilus sp. TaxID=3028392 RepID=UPI002ACDC0CA|nr:tRNA pseudouridine(55) synthase TruB [Thiohalophilus sp.]MDZ7662680.1 tRNA pseudouridine(55) synthase TruB [Thiohalophilus sp.]
MARRRPQGRPVNGILLLDKPVGLTSNAALQQVKRLFKAAKAGHTGNLDPLASGLLPLCFGEATKFSAFLLDSDKHYIGTCKLGVTTTSADAEGEVLERKPVGHYGRAEVETVLAGFVGDIEQIPPMHSAIKVNGQPLYKLAHQGKEIAREPRRITLYALELVSLDGDELVLDVRCSKGTYVRTLAEDIGRQLGCGAHLSALRRSGAGPFSIEQAVALNELERLAESGLAALDQALLPVEAALGDWPQLVLTDNTAYYLRQGQAVQIPQAPTSGLVRLFVGDQHRFIGVGRVLADGRVAPQRLVSHAG